MREKENNISEENDPIKKMLERLRRSVTDLPDEEEPANSGDDTANTVFENIAEEIPDSEAAPSEEEDTEDLDKAPFFEAIEYEESDDASTDVADEETADELDDADIVDEDVIAQFFAPADDEVLEDTNPIENTDSNEEAQAVSELQDEAEHAEGEITDLPQDVILPHEEREEICVPVEETLSVAEFEDALSWQDLPEEPESAPDTAYLANKPGDTASQAEALRGNRQKSMETVAVPVEEEPYASPVIPTPFDPQPENEAVADARPEPIIPAMHTEISDKEAELLFTRRRDMEEDARRREWRTDVRDERDSFADEVDATEENGYAVEVEVRDTRTPIFVPNSVASSVEPTAEMEIPPTEEPSVQAAEDVFVVDAESDMNDEDGLHDDFLEMLAEGRANTVREQKNSDPVVPDAYARRKSIRKAARVLGNSVTGEQIEMDFFAETAAPITVSPEKNAKEEAPPMPMIDEPDFFDIEEDDDLGYDVAPLHEIPVTPFSSICEETPKEAPAPVEVPAEPTTESSSEKERSKKKKKISPKRSRVRKNEKRVREEELAAVSGIYEESAAAFNEFTSRNQIGTIGRRFLSDLSVAILRIVVLAFLTAAFFAAENMSLLGLSLSGFISNDTMLVAIHFVGIVLTVLFSYPVFVTAWRNLFCRRVTGELYLAILLSLTVIYDVLLFFLPSAEPLMFGFLAAGGALVAAIGDHAKTGADLASFRLLSSSGDKLACKITKEGATVSEREALVDLPEGVFTRVLSVKKIGFAKGFFHRITRSCEDSRSNLILLAVAACVSLTAALIRGLLENSFMSAMYTFLVSFSLSLPFVLLLLRKLPQACLSRRAERAHSAVVGEVSAIEYSDIGAMAFEDVEAFSSRNVVVQRIKTYGNSSLADVLYRVASLFSAVGGPLDGIFRSSTADFGISEDIALLSVVDGGILARVDGKEISAGSGDYMMAERIHVFFDPEDEKILESGKVNILYAAEEGRLIAKFYIRYKMNADFEKSVEQLHKCGIRTLIRTYDPLITDALLRKTSYTVRFGVRIVRKTAEQQNDFAEPSLNSGIVSRTSTHDILQTLYSCRRAVRLTRAAKVASYVASGVGMAGALLLSSFGLIGTLPTLLFAGFEALLLTVYSVTAKLYI